MTVACQIAVLRFLSSCVLLTIQSVLIAKVARMEALHGFPQSNVFPKFPLIAAGKYRMITKFGGEIGLMP